MNRQRKFMRCIEALRLAALLATVWTATPSSTLRADSGDRRSGAISPRSSDTQAGKNVSAANARPSGRTSASGWGTTGGTLALVVVLILVGAKLLKARSISGPASLPDDAIRVLGRKAIDYRNSIHLVRCGSRILVLGSSQTGLTPLAEISDKAEVESLAALAQPAEPSPATESIARWLQRLRSDNDERPAGDEADLHESAPDPDPAILRLRTRLAAATPVHDDSSEDRSPGREAKG